MTDLELIHKYPLIAPGDVTDPTDVDSSIPEVWSKQTLRRVKVGGYWGKFTGSEGSGAPIIQKTELQNAPGDLIHVQVTDPLTGAGVEGDTAILEGNEESLATSEIKCATKLYRHGVRLFNRANKKSILDLRGEARMRLEEWVQSKIDDKRWEMFVATALPAPLNAETYAPNIYVVGGGTGVNDVAGTDVLTVQAIQALKLSMRLQQAKPLVAADGKEHYVLVTHPNTTFKLKRETEYRDWVREAEVRGKDNPFFRGALAVIDGVVIHDHEKVPTVTNSGSVKVAKSLMFGAEAFVEALDEGISYKEKLFDYDEQYGLAVRTAFGDRRALEINSAQVYVAAETVAV